MQRKRVFVLGANGQVGRSVCRALAEHTDASLVLGGRHLERVEKVAEALGRPERLSTCYADASDPASLESAFQGSDLVIVAATARDHIENLVRACLRTGSDYMDTLETEDVVRVLRGLEPEMRQAGRLFVTQSGMAPGVSGALVRLAASRFQRVRHARLAMAFSLQSIEKKQQVYYLFEFVVSNTPVVYRDGVWQRQSLTADRAVIDCGPRFGRRSAIPLDMIEARGLPEALGLESFGYYATGANRAVDLVLRRLLTGLHRIRPQLGWSMLAGLALRFAKKQSEPPGGVIVVEAEGDGGRDRSLRLLVDVEDNYRAVGQAVAVVARQHLEGAFKGQVGVHIMGQIADPEALVGDLQALGIEHRETWRPTPLGL